MRVGEIEIIHRAGDIKIGIGVEAVGERQPLVPQIGFNLEVGVEAEALDVARLQTAAELLGQPFLCLLYTSPSPRDRTRSRMPSSA